MTAPPTLAGPPELTPLADLLAGVLRQLRPLPADRVELARSPGRVLAAEVRASAALPAFDQAAIDGYATRCADLLGAAPQHPVRLNVVGDLTASSADAGRLTPGTCTAVAAGAPLPVGADAVVPPAWTDQGMAAIEVWQQPRRGQGLRRAGDEVRAGAVVGAAGARVTPALVAVLAATGVGQVLLRARPRVAVISTGAELIAAGRSSRPGRVVDVNTLGLCAAADDAGGVAEHARTCGDEAGPLLRSVTELLGEVDLIVTSGGTGTGPGDLIRRVLARDGGVAFTPVSLFPGTALGFGLLATVPGLGAAGGANPAPGARRGGGTPVICLPGDPGAALIGFEVLARPVIQALAGGEPFRRGVRAHLLETVFSPLGLREFRPAAVSERRGGGYTARPLAGGPYTLSGMGQANGLIVLGERIGNAAAGSTVDVLLLDPPR